MEPPKFLLAAGAYNNELFLPAGSLDNENSSYKTFHLTDHANDTTSGSTAMIEGDSSAIPATAPLVDSAVTLANENNPVSDSLQVSADADWSAVNTIELETRGPRIEAVEAASEPPHSDINTVQPEPSINVAKTEKETRYALSDAVVDKQSNSNDSVTTSLGRLNLQQVTDYLRTSSSVLEHHHEIRTNTGGGFLTAIRNFFGGNRPLKSALHAERDFVFCLALTPFSNEDPMHTRMLFSLFEIIMKYECPARFGEHWDAIGFQGKDPATDLRGAGMLGLLQLLTFSMQHEHLAKDIYALSTDAAQNFPFALIGINFTSLVLSCARDPTLNKTFNKRGSVLGFLNDLYAALFSRFYTIWRTEEKTIADSGNVLSQLQAAARKDCAGLVNQFLEASAPKSEQKASPSAQKNQSADFTEFSNI